MRDLIGRLEVVDGDAASALRVIDYFDRLVDEHAPIGAFVRAAAVLAGCPAGLHVAGRGLTRRSAADGRALPEDDSHAWPRAVVPGEAGSWVWLERTGAPGPLDALVLERLARAIHALSASSAPRSAGAAVRIACDPDATPADRRDAATRLGLAGPVTVVVRAAGERPSPRSAEIGPHVVTLLPGTPALPGDIQAGTAVAERPELLPTAFARARVALRLADRPAGLGPSLVSYHELGALAAVAERFSAPEASAVDDVRRLDELLIARPWVIDTLQAVTGQATLRQASAILHVHHSTVQERLAWLATRLGYAPTEPVGRHRAAVALLLWRIAHSDDEPADGGPGHRSRGPAVGGSGADGAGSGA
ncbi:hypothetical protein [Dactylosporangium sp. CA-092794]|uniref:hypothetical protein n=1 Tax=Dactylosporangium sp. CA-092794 TaxID=3239929 RepID=UPI003D916C4E